jgi:hypothetical protein
MSCDQCPHCQKEAGLGVKNGVKFGVQKGGLVLNLQDRSTENKQKEKASPKLPTRGKAREYSAPFEVAWKAYVRREQKFEAFGIWLLRAKEVGGEAQLLTLVLGALQWQVPNWGDDGVRFAPYFERYLKRRKWEDEQVQPAPQRNGTTKAPVPFAVAAEEARQDRHLERMKELLFDE